MDQKMVVIAKKLIALANTLAGLSETNQVQMDLMQMMGGDPMEWITEKAKPFRELYQKDPEVHQKVDQVKILPDADYRTLLERIAQALDPSYKAHAATGHPDAQEMLKRREFKPGTTDHANEAQIDPHAAEEEKKYG